MFYWAVIFWIKLGFALDRSSNATERVCLIDGSNDGLLNPGKTIQHELGIVRTRVASVLRSIEVYPEFIDLVFSYYSVHIMYKPSAVCIYIYIHTHKHRRERPVNHHPHKHRRMHPMCRLPGPLAEWQNHPKAGKWKSGFWVYSMAVAWKRLGRRVVQATNDLVWKAVWSSVLIHAADDAGDRIPPGIIGIVCSYWYQLGRVIWIVKSKHSCCAYKRAPLKLHRFQLGEYGSEEIHPIFTLLAT